LLPVAIYPDLDDRDRVVELCNRVETG